ncbi:hypothetical protein L3Y34_005337 [Caenorhabditis briggsae]|uniref:C-type LECtin n=1 Tax=Caenorhabditis briggsae TaxID=6238 RepID=A0AAE9AEF7_CAEBR|nr:hypothetical protein L3Y34_005337 [Caenorhabditis briggsae]
MKLHFLLFFFVFGLIHAICPPGFSPSNGKCIMLVTDQEVHSSASAYCNRYGGHLISIHNPDDNNELAGMAARPVWIGLKCTVSRDPSSCLWDDQSGTAQGYNGFSSGQPNTAAGQCIYLLNTGHWQSVDCDGGIPLDFICEAPNQPSCNHPFNGFCYFPQFQPLPENDARVECEKQCGNLVSIHSPDENNFIKNLFNLTPPDFATIGARTNSANLTSWLDGTNWNDYQNIGLQSASLGMCWSMALRDRVLYDAGQWTNSNCSKPAPFVCKRDAQVSCGGTDEPVTTAPPECGSGIMQEDNNGTFYSPNFPNSYVGAKNPCKYFIDTPSGTQAQIRFPILNLDAYSTIQLYYGDNQKPDVTIYSDTTMKWYTSPTNTIKMIFKPSTDYTGSRILSWKAEFEPMPQVTVPRTTTTTHKVIITPDPRNPSGCNSPSISTETGYFTSPNYPDNYLDSMTCKYLLTTDTDKRIHLEFGEIDLFMDQDEIIVRDGSSFTDPNPLEIINGNPGHWYNKQYTSTGNTMNVYFFSDSRDNAKGFSANFYALNYSKPEPNNLNYDKRYQKGDN